MKKTVIIFSIAVLSACSAKLLPITQADADRGATKYPGITTTDLNDGKAQFEQNCGRCHGFKAPESRTVEQWHTIVPRMAKKAKIDSKTEEQILKYVVTMSGAKPAAK